MLQPSEAQEDLQEDRQAPMRTGLAAGLQAWPTASVLSPGLELRSHSCRPLGGHPIEPAIRSIRHIFWAEQEGGDVQESPLNTADTVFVPVSLVALETHFHRLKKKNSVTFLVLERGAMYQLASKCAKQNHTSAVKEDRDCF